MAELAAIRGWIADLAARPKSVEFREIERIVAQLGQNDFVVRRRKTRHGVMFTIIGKDASTIFQVSDHNPGSSSVKKCYVDNFLEAMAELGIYEE